MNKKETSINFIVSLLSNLVILILGLIIPRIILINYGSDTNGLMGTLNQIYTCTALLEAGIGQATRNSLYSPITSKDKDSISKVMSISRSYYRKISIVYLAVSICMSFCLPLVLKSSLNYWTIFAITILEGLISVSSFFFIQDWSCLLMAEGKTYVISILEFSTKILTYVLKIILVAFSVPFVYIELSFLIISFIKIFLYFCYCRKKYSWISFSKNKNGEKLPDRRSYVVTEIAWAIFSSTDMILLSIFCSTELASVYSVYAMVFTAMNSLLSSVYNSISYILGQSFSYDKKKYIKYHDAFNTFFLGTMTVLVCVSDLLMIPFIKLYTSDINDANYIYKWLPLLFCLIQLFSWSRYTAGNLTGIAGFAKQTSVVSLIEAFMNVILSLALVSYSGVYGVTIATVVSLPLKVVYVNYLADIKIMKRSPWKTLSILGVNYLIFGITVIIQQFVTLNIDSYYSFALYGFILVLIYAPIVYGFNLIVNKDFSKYIFKTVTKSLK
jgi:O-antigen/teichoic acid export membrane protein